MNNLTLMHSRITQTADKITSFKQLQAGWHFGSGVPPTEEAIAKALVLNAEAEKVGFIKTNAFAGIDGEIRVTAYHGPIYLELTIEPDGLITYVYELDNQEIAYEENLSFEGALAKLHAFWGALWVSSGLSTETTTTQTNSDSKVLLSGRPVTAAAYPSLTKSVFYKPARVFASISRDSTKMYREPLLSFGTYSPKSFLSSAGSSSRPVKLETLAIITS